MKHSIKYSFLVLALFIGAAGPVLAQEKAKKILVIGVDGIINTALDYATTPGVDHLLADASFSMSGYSGVPAYSTTGWATLLTGVGPQKHGVVADKTFTGHKFDAYPSVINRIKSVNTTDKVASIVRNEGINTLLNSNADYKFHFDSDGAVFDKTAELLQQADIGSLFIQFSSPAEVGKEVGYQLREARYVQAIQQIDTYVEQLRTVLTARPTYANESWAVFLVSTHGGTETGITLNNSSQEFDVPIILSGGALDKKELIGTAIDARENNDNILTIDKASSGDKTFVRVPIGNTPLQGMDKFTIELWVKAGANSSDPSIIGDKDWDSGGNPGFTLCRSGSSWKINIASDKRQRYDIGSGKTLEDGNWHHMCVTFDKTNECIVYQDGEKVAESKLTYKPEDDMASPYDYICLAQEGTQRYGGGAPNWAGSFNEVRIWTDVLSPQTIKNYMYQRDIESSTHPNLSSLNLYLKLDEVRGTVIQDHSGKGHHAELVGPASERHPLYPIGMTDVAINILSHLDIRVDGTWGLEGNSLKSNVPFRLFKVK
ncbi:type I phosphodiesterase/nucleotide pyrophosphatase [Dyadobacter jejuensis]|uniref:Type I phosphodiesterase/nucleotide pyrophosphatase n=1 Tax=Dyadobacter jejuensis TaxID=1082580 RepID=A0A316AH72_9BACT|nr:LamG-like jellyroll fold domain-containing protein [Dyadobacter jejuensis]PWJ57053.1 type I phosphodiesterase/nucleotide pyrophosphatase [Dyadobacter jejuensis]